MARGAVLTQVAPAQTLCLPGTFPTLIDSVLRKLKLYKPRPNMYSKLTYLNVGNMLVAI